MHKYKNARRLEVDSRYNTKLQKFQNAQIQKNVGRLEIDSKYKKKLTQLTKCKDTKMQKNKITKLTKYKNVGRLLID